MKKQIKSAVGNEKVYRMTYREVKTTSCGGEGPLKDLVVLLILETTRGFIRSKGSSMATSLMFSGRIDIMFETQVIVIDKSRQLSLEYEEQLRGGMMESILIVL